MIPARINGEMAISLSELGEEITDLFQAAGLEDARVEMRLFLRELAGLELEEQLSNPHKRISDEDYLDLMLKAKRRAAREPLAYIKGEAWFFGRSFLLAPGLLVPRPDSEVLLEEAIALLRRRPAKRLKILDLCSGAGCLGLSLLAELTDRDIEAELLLSDKSKLALTYARKNARRLDLTAATAYEQADLWPRRQTADKDKSYDLLLCNPPYIPTAEIEALMPEVSCWEDRLALDGGPDGLDFYRRLKKGYNRFLAADGIMILELGAGQAEDVLKLFSAREQRRIYCKKDYNGIDRALVLNNSIC